MNRHESISEHSNEASLKFQASDTNARVVDDDDESSSEQDRNKFKVVENGAL